jgi:voltage-gated sodium channel
MDEVRCGAGIDRRGPGESLPRMQTQAQKTNMPSMTITSTGTTSGLTTPGSPVPGGGAGGGSDGGPVDNGAGFPGWCLRLTGTPWFQRAVVGLILFAGLLVGAETHRPWMEAHGALFHTLDRVVLALFVVELGLRLATHGARPWRFFRDPWNVFDAVIVGVCLLPFHTEFAAVLRLVRVLRVLRLVTAVPRLQLLVGALIKSVPSMSYVALLLSLLFYVYAVAGVALFGGADPARFGGLPDAALTLFQIITMEAWAEIMHAQFATYPSRVLPVVYFVSFILLGTMIMLNLFIGVIVNGMDEARQEMADEERARHLARTGHTTAGDDIAALRGQLAAMQQGLAALERRLRE